MERPYRTLAVALACVFWGSAILLCRHHLSDLIPLLGSWMLACGVGLAAMDFLYKRRQR
jgi:CHASE2 domain-containing sensor protein